MYVARGLSPVRVSNAAIETAIAGMPIALLSQAWAYGYQEAGHTFYVLNFPDQNYVHMLNYSLAYDLTTGLWHERSYNSNTGPWPCAFASVPALTANGPNFAGDYYSGKIYFQGLSYPSDGGAAITYIRTAPHVSNSDRWLKYSRLEVRADIGTAQPTLDYSDDGGKTFGGRTRAMQQAVSQARRGVRFIPAIFRHPARQIARSRFQADYYGQHEPDSSGECPPGGGRGK